MTDIETSLAEAPDTYEVPAEPDARFAYQLQSLEHATWAMRRLRDLQRQRLDVVATATREIDRVSRWAAEQDSRLSHDVEFFESILTAYALDRRAADAKQKTLSTPFGEVGTREVAPAVAVEDPAAFIAWAKQERPELVKVAESVRAADAKKALVVADGKVIDPKTGEVVPGAAVTPGKVTATVRPDVIEHG